MRFPRGMCRELVQKNAPREFIQHARNPARNVHIGGNCTVFAPAYGSPFIHNLDEGRRYARIDDFRNFVKLAYMANSLHHSGGTICEPVDLPVNKRHLDMVYSHMKYSDKPFMGSVTRPERAADSVELAKIVFGADAVDPATGKPRTMMISLINVNSPMVYDATMLGALKVYARANQATIITPFILVGRDVAGDGGRHGRADAGRGAGRHGVRAARQSRRAGGARQLRVVDLDAVRRADVRHARAGAGAVHDGRAGAAARRAVPLRRQPVRLEGAGCAGGVRVGADAAADLPRRA